MSEVVSFFPPIRRRGPVLRNRVAIVFIFLVFFVPCRANGTWKLVGRFPTPIGCGFFFDENNGLIGSGIRLATFDPCAIYKTTDGGTTWTPCQVPTSINGAVTSIWMQDSLVGYASIFSDMNYGVYGTFGRSALWKTTDGGTTWFDSLHLDHILNDVYSQNGLIVITNWDNYYGGTGGGGGDYSYDGGATWTQDFRRCNGIAFSDSLNGVITEMNSNSGGDNFWYTVDAGGSWLASLNNQYESWSVYAVPNEHIFFCANESQPYIPLPYSNINWSPDSGKSWAIRTPFPDMHFTGTIAGAGQTLYFQTDTTSASYINGLYRSDDLGLTWHSVGGPTNSRDTRFIVTGCMGQTVYAFDATGSVYKTIDGGDGKLVPNIAFDNDTLFWEPNVCGDSIPISLGALNCIPVTIDSVFIPSSSEFLSYTNGTSLPQTLSKPDSTVIQLVYSPTKGGSVSSSIKVFGHSGDRSLAKVLTIVTSNTLRSNISLSSDSCALSAGACATGTDSILISSAACWGMVLDSLILQNGEVVSLDSFPISLPNESSYPVHFAFSPDSAGSHAIKAQLFVHDGRRPFDTTITISAVSVQPRAQFILDTTAIIFATKYCNPVTAALQLSTNACDSLRIDSIRSTNGTFILDSIPSSLFSQKNVNVGVRYDPDSAGTDSGVVRIYAHGRGGRVDTTISLIATNYSLPQIETLSDTAFTLATTGCQSLIDSLILGNEGCEQLQIDSLRTTDDSELFLQFDSSKVPMAGGGRVPIQIVYDPQNGTSKSCSVHLFAHTASKTIDTTITLALSNLIPANPLQLSTDSLWLFTKYCQPITVPLHIGNFGCVSAIDSVWITGDSEQEFSFLSTSDSLHSGGWDSTTVKFIPNGPGIRSLQAHLEFQSNGKKIDTVLSIAAKNLTAPVPFIPPLASKKPGEILSIPVMIQPTADTFTIHSYSFHLAFNTNLLDSIGLDFSQVCDAKIDSSKFWPDANGVSVRVWLNDTISDTARLNLPLVSVQAKVYLTIDTTTPVALDAFVTDREPTLAPCSVPEQTFVLQQACGDPLLLQALRGDEISFGFISVSPNPAQSGNWDVGYAVYDSKNPLGLNIYSSSGTLISHVDDVPNSSGIHHISVPIAQSSGDYFLVLTDSHGAVARKCSVER